MKRVYPIIITEPENNEGYLVYIPDFDINTEGKSIEDAIQMAKDAIGLAALSLKDMGKEIPDCVSLEVECNEKQISALIDIDFSSYKSKRDNRSVKKNCTIPYWLNKKAEEAHINFSQALQEALIQIIELN